MIYKKENQNTIKFGLLNNRSNRMFRDLCQKTEKESYFKCL